MGTLEVKSVQSIISALKQVGQTVKAFFLVLSIVLISIQQPAAQSPSAPLNLGTVIQQNTPKPRSYIKLPETIPVPAAKPATPKPSGENTTLTPAGETAQDPILPPPGAVPEEMTIDTQGQARPKAEIEQPKIEPGGIATLQLVGYLKEETQVLQRGVNWRIYEEKRDDNGRLPMLHNQTGGPLAIELPPGKYIIYAGYGFANLTKRLVLPKAGTYSESFVLQAGAVRLNAVAAGDVPLDDSLLSFDIYTVGDGNGAGQEAITRNVKADHVVKLTEGTYHIVSSYGTSNAKVRGDVEIESGKLVSVTMIHHAAKVTLRLVSEPGGEALANTVWTVLTPGGDVVKRAIGAFPTLALAAGDYTAIAKQNDEVYNRNFSVDSGLDRNIEVLAKLQ